MEKIGIDVHKVATQVCILTEDGEFKEFRIRTERDALTEAIGRRGRAHPARGGDRERMGRSTPRGAGPRSDRGRPKLRANVRQPQSQSKN
jgi:hypothetical protein